MSQAPNNLNILDCIENFDAKKCFGSNSVQKPTDVLNTIRAETNKTTREKNGILNINGSNTNSASSNIDGLFVAAANTNATSNNNDNNVASPTTEGTTTPNSETGQAATATDDGGENREGTSPDSQAARQIETQKEADSQITYDGGNKAFPYITPLATTNFASLEKIEPLTDAQYGANGTLYNVQLANEDGIIYLRQYISATDENTGAVWRFQYAPQISYSRSATFQEDVSWGTNVQPSHYTNTSGKKITIQGAILEGMTIGKTVTGAIKALETLMSVVNPDNQEQVAPYAYRLIVGARTITEPIRGNHAPFIIEQISVQELMYDAKGEVILAKVDLNLKEVPYYQINDGRKLLLVATNVAEESDSFCEKISEQLKELDEQTKNRFNENATVIAETDGKKDELLKVPSRLQRIDQNCVADNKALNEYITLLQEYEQKKCSTEKHADGLSIIQNNFSRGEGIYETLLGRPLEVENIGPFAIGVIFDENGAPITNVFNTTLRQIREIVEEGAIGARPPLNVINVPGSAGAFKNYLQSCKPLNCNSRQVGDSLSVNKVSKYSKLALLFSENPNAAKDLLDGNNEDLTDKALQILESSREKLGTNKPRLARLCYPTGNERLGGILSSLNRPYTGKKFFNEAPSSALNKIRTQLLANNNFGGRRRSLDTILENTYGNAANCSYMPAALLENAIDLYKKENCNKKALLNGLVDTYEQILKDLDNVVKNVLKTSSYNLSATDRTFIDDMSGKAGPTCQSDNTPANKTNGRPCPSVYITIKAAQKIAKIFNDEGFDLQSRLGNLTIFSVKVE